MNLFARLCVTRYYMIVELFEIVSMVYNNTKYIANRFCTIEKTSKQKTESKISLRDKMYFSGLFTLTTVPNSQYDHEYSIKVPHLNYMKNIKTSFFFFVVRLVSRLSVISILNLYPTRSHTPAAVFVYNFQSYLTISVTVFVFS